VFTLYGSLDGLNWAPLGASQTVTMAQNVYVGLAASSRSTSSLATASFDNVSVTRAVPPSPNFSISASPSGLTIVQGAAGVATITVTPLNGFNGSVSLSAIRSAQRRDGVVQPQQHGGHEHIDADGQQHGNNRNGHASRHGHVGQLNEHHDSFLSP